MLAEQSSEHKAAERPAAVYGQGWQSWKFFRDSLNLTKGIKVKLHVTQSIFYSLCSYCFIFPILKVEVIWATRFNKDRKKIGVFPMFYY